MPRRRNSGLRTVGSNRTTRSHAYALLRTILNTAVSDDIIAANPCRIRGAGQAKRVKRIKRPTLDEPAALVAAMPNRYRLVTLLAAWCGLRFGELTDLRRKDIDVAHSVIRIRRGVVRADHATIIATPNSDPDCSPAARCAARVYLAKGVSGGFHQ